VARRRDRIRRSARRAGGILAGNTSKKIMAGIGSAKVGEMVGSRIGMSPIIPAAALGYFTAGPTGLLVAIGTEIISGRGFNFNNLGTQQQSTPAGTVYN
jgi:hypothetical protein